MEDENGDLFLCPPASPQRIVPNRTHTTSRLMPHRDSVPEDSLVVTDAVDAAPIQDVIRPEPPRPNVRSDLATESSLPEALLQPLHEPAASVDKEPTMLVSEGWSLRLMCSAFPSS